MIITKIEPQKKHKNRSSVFLDGHFAFGISDFDVLRYRLKEGQDLSENDLKTIQNEVLFQDAKQYALKLLDRQSYTEKALYRKMADRGCEPSAITKTVSFLKEYGYLDDAAYARHYFESALRVGKSGMRKIRYDLIEKGIDRNTLEEIISEFDESQITQNESLSVLPLLEKKLKGDFSFPNLMKAKRYCLARGFSVEAIDNAVRKLQIEENDFFE